MYNDLKPYIDQKLMSVKTMKIGNDQYEIMCYSKEQFFKGEWDDISINHRGRIYKNGVSINNPFPKIFNLDENEFSKASHVAQLIEDCNEYEILDKLNGHLVIVSYDKESGNVLVSTKGSFEGLADLDRALVKSLGIESAIKKYDITETLMFECIADYDQHLHFEAQLAKYSPNGKNTLALIGAIGLDGTSNNHDVLGFLGTALQVPVTKRFPMLESDMNYAAMYAEKGIEGFVIHFPKLNYRVKIKTTEYTTLHYLGEMKVDKIINKLYNSGIDQLYAHYDEEMYPILDAVKEDFVEFISKDLLGSEVQGMIGLLEPREIAKRTDLTQVQKSWLFRNSNDTLHLMQSKTVRGLFKSDGTYTNTQTAINNLFAEKAA